MTLEDFFVQLANWADLFFWCINEGFKIFFNDIRIFEVALGWWFILVAILGLIVYRVGD